MQESTFQELKITQTSQIPVQKTMSENIALEIIETEVDCISQDEAYQQLVNKWARRQKQSFNNLTGERENIYIYDPNNIDFSVYQKPVSQERSDIFEKYTPQIWRYLNSKFIMEEIIQPLQIHKVLNEQTLQHVEFFYLLSFRAWSEMNVVMRAFNQKRSSSASFKEQKNKRKISQQQIQFIFNSSDINMKYLVEPMIKFYAKIETIFNHYHKILTEKQNYFKYKLKAITDFIFHYSTKITQDKFMCGFEGIDFTRDQQIQFLEAFCVKNILIILKLRQDPYCQNIIAKLSIMRELLKMEVKKMEGYDDFDRIKKELIDNWKQKSQKV